MYLTNIHEILNKYLLFGTHTQRQKHRVNKNHRTKGRKKGRVCIGVSDCLLYGFRIKRQLAVYLFTSNRVLCVLCIQYKRCVVVVAVFLPRSTLVTHSVCVFFVALRRTSNNKHRVSFVYCLCVRIKLTRTIKPASYKCTIWYHVANTRSICSGYIVEWEALNRVIRGNFHPI